jgi:hypothetical protein
LKWAPGFCREGGREEGRKDGRKGGREGGREGRRKAFFVALAFSAFCKLKRSNSPLGSGIVARMFAFIVKTT